MYHCPKVHWKSNTDKTVFLSSFSSPEKFLITLQKQSSFHVNLKNGSVNVSRVPYKCYTFKREAK